MTRVTKEKANEHKNELIDAAGRLFREKGLDGVGVAEISRTAGLTHGAIYSGFASKNELAIAALKAGAEASRNRLAKATGADPDLGTILEYYASKRQRDDRTNCCPMLASASEAARQNDDYREAFGEAFLEFVATVQAAMERQGTPDARRKALGVTAGLIGAVAIARSLDGPTSDDLLSAVHATFAKASV